MTITEQEPIYTGEPGEIVRAVSHESEPVRLMWDNRTHVLPPEQSTFVPWEVMMNYFGDPRSSTTVKSHRDERGLRSFISDRATEIRRIRTKWGFEMIDGTDVPYSEEFLADRGRKGDQMVTVKVPRVSFYGLEGQPIHTVVDDPSGDNITQASSTVAAETGKDAIIRKQGQQLDALMRMAQERGWMEQEKGPEPMPVKVKDNGETEQLLAPPPEDNPNDSLPEDEH